MALSSTKASRHRTGKKKRRLIRRESLFTRLRNLPYDLALAASELIETIEWAALRWSVLVPAGVGANAALLLCRVFVDRARAPGGVAANGEPALLLFPGAMLVARAAAWIWAQFIGRRALEQGGLYGTDDDIFNVMDSNESGTASGKKRLILYVIPLVLGWLLVLGSTWNTVNCMWMRRRKYYLAERPLNHQIDWASARIEPVATIYVPNDNDENSSNTNIFTFLLSFFSNRLQSSMPTPSVADLDSGRQQLVWTLDTWDPSVVNLHLLALFSPLNALMLWFGPLGFFNTVLFVPLLTVFLAYLVLGKFETKVADIGVLHAEVLREYETSVVRPLSSVARRDVAIGVDGSVSFYSPSLNHQFRPRHEPRKFDHTFAAVPPLPPQEILGAPVFPSTLAAANAVRKRESLPPFKLTYNSAGYYTGSPKTVPTTSSSHGSSHDFSSSPARHNQGLVDTTAAVNTFTTDRSTEGSPRRSPASLSTYNRPTEDSLFRRLHR